MRYATGVFVGALLPGIVFVGAALINIMGYGISDAGILAGLWSLYLIWCFVSIIIFATPLLFARFARRDSFREISLYVIGGFSFFSPIWFCVAAELSGNSIINLILNGVTHALPGPGSGGDLIGISIPSFLLIPILSLLAIIGIYILRPSFVTGISKPTVSTALDELIEPTETDGTEPSEESELEPEAIVAPPITDESSKQELMNLLTELKIPGATIQLIIDAGFRSVTDLVATGADQLAKLTGIDKKEAEDLYMAVQKHVWFKGVA